jgi:predicted nucleic acid-binding protein
MPFARILYWETTRKTPDKVTLELEFEDGTLHTYEVSTFKMLDQSLETLEQRKMMLLFPFCLLKFRKEVKKPGTSSEKRKQLAEEMKKLLHKLEKLVEHSRVQGLLSDGDAKMVMERIEQMNDELYNSYPEFEETRMELRERLRTPLADAIRESERKGEQKAGRRIITLLEQGCTVEQLKEILAKESQQSAASTLQ